MTGELKLGAVMGVPPDRTPGQNPGQTREERIGPEMPRRSKIWWRRSPRMVPEMELP